MSGLKSIRIRRIAGLGGLVIVATLIAAVLAGPTAAHHGKGGHAGGDEGTNETATFTFVVSGDLIGSVTTTIPSINGKERAIGNNPEIGEDLELDMGVFLGNNANSSGWDLEKCFAGSEFKFTGSGVGVIADRKNPGDGRSGFWFTAKGTDGTTDVQYKLAGISVDIPLPAVWPYWLPDVGQTVTVATKVGEPWEMSTTNGPGKSVACTGEGTTGDGTAGGALHFEIAITRIS